MKLARLSDGDHIIRRGGGLTWRRGIWPRGEAAREPGWQRSAEAADLLAAVGVWAQDILRYSAHSHRPLLMASPPSITNELNLREQLLAFGPAGYQRDEAKAQPVTFFANVSRDHKAALGKDVEVEPKIVGLMLGRMAEKIVDGEPQVFVFGNFNGRGTQGKTYLINGACVRGWQPCRCFPASTPQPPLSSHIPLRSEATAVPGSPRLAGRSYYAPHVRRRRHHSQRACKPTQGGRRAGGAACQCHQGGSAGCLQAESRSLR